MSDQVQETNQEGIDPMREENVHRNEEPGEMNGLQFLTNFMGGARKAGAMQGPYNPLLTPSLVSYFKFVQAQLEKDELPATVVEIPQGHVSTFRQIYGFDIPSQVELLKSRNGGEWSEDEIVLGTPCHDLMILATDDMPEHSYYVIQKRLHLNGYADNFHYVVMVDESKIHPWPDGWYLLGDGTTLIVSVQDEYCGYFRESANWLYTFTPQVERVYVVDETEAGALRDALRTLLGERDIEQVWKGELEWQNAAPIFDRILNYSLSPNGVKVTPKT